VSHEAIYGWIYALSKGELTRRELVLRSGRTRRRPTLGRAPQALRIKGICWIEDRPAYATAARSPGSGKTTWSPAGAARARGETLVERVSRFVVPVPPAGLLRSGLFGR
jgi:IS30 family transposase